MQRGCRVYFGCMGSDGQLVSVPAEMHNGALVNIDLSIGGEEGDQITATSESELQIFERASNVRYTAAQLQLEYSGDDGLEYLEKMEDARPVWRGKNQVLAGTAAPRGFDASPYFSVPTWR